jgi:hypothetical protein
MTTANFAVGRGESLRIVDPVLSGVAQGYKNADLVGTSLFPIIPADKEAGWLVKYGKEAFKIYNTRRPMRGRPGRVDLGVDKLHFVLNEESIEVPVDDREIAEQNENLIPLQRRNTLYAMAMIALAMEKQQADLAVNASNYPSGHKPSLTKWDASSGSDPVGDVLQGKEVIRSDTGRYPNTLLMGPLVFKACQTHPAFLERIKYSERAIITEDIIAAVLGLDKVIVGKAIWQNEKGVSTDVWGKNAVLAYVPKPGDPQGDGIPAYGYTLRRRGYPQTQVYREEPKLGVVYVADLFSAVITGADAGYLLANLVS